MIMANINEIWLPVKGYEGFYEVSNLGNIKSLNYRKSGKEKILKPGVLRHGYEDVALWKNKAAKYPMIHRIVAIAFLGNPNNLKQVNHKNGIKSDNRVDNLEWVTPSRNIRHAYEIGKMTPNPIKGEDHYCSKITNQQAIQIYNSTGRQEKIAELFGVSRYIVSNIKTGKGWSHITGHVKNEQN